MNEKRSCLIKVYVTPDEKRVLKEKCRLAEMNSVSAYIRKVALTGYIIHFDFPELRELTSLLKRISNNVNQIARRVNANDCLYQEDLREIITRQEELFQAMRTIIIKLGEIG